MLSVVVDDHDMKINTVIRGDVNSIKIGNKVNIQDGAIVIKDILGRETKEKNNIFQFYIYDDGTVEKKLIIK